MVRNRVRPMPSAADDQPAPSFQQVTAHLNDAKQFAAVYVATQTARFKAQAQKVALYTIIGITAGVLGLLAVGTIGVVSVVFFCNGAAGAIAALLGQRQWAGELIVGTIILGTTLVAGWIAVVKVRKMIRRQTLSDYLKAKAPL